MNTDTTNTSELNRAKAPRRIKGAILGGLILAAVCVSLLIALGIAGAAIAGANTPSHIQDTWASGGKAYGHVSAYLDTRANITAEQIEDAHYRLKKDSEANGTGYEGLALSNYCFSGDSRIEIVTYRDKISEARVIGVGGDFFSFHPLNLLNGFYFSENDLMKDSIILDDHAALRLFGSVDVEGANVTIYDRPFVVTAVYATPTDRLSKASGEEAGFVYMHYSMLEEMELANGINVVEFASVEPLDGVAYTTIQPIIGSLCQDETMVDIVDNTNRLSMGHLFKLLGDRYTRSMRTKAIYYPYYENETRAIEDTLALLLSIGIIVLCVLLIDVVIVLLYAYRHSGLSVADYLKWIFEKIRRSVIYVWKKTTGRRSGRRHHKGQRKGPEGTGEEL